MLTRLECSLAYYVRYTIFLLISLICNYKSFSKVIMILRNAFFGTIYLYSRGDVITLRLLLTIWAYIRLVGINYYVLVKFSIFFNIALMELRYFLTFLVRFRLRFNKRIWLKYRLVALKISLKAPLLLIIFWNYL